MPLDIHVRAAARAGLGKEEEVHQLAEEQFQRQVAFFFFLVTQPCTTACRQDEISV